MKKYLFFVCIICAFACTKTVTTERSFEENGVGWPYYIIHHPIDSLEASLVGDFTFDAVMYGALNQKIDGNHGVDTVYLITSGAPLSPHETRENLWKRGFIPAGVGYLLGMMREYAEIFKRQYRFPASIETGGLVTSYGGMVQPVRTVLLYTVINGPPLLWCMTSNAAPGIYTEYVCFRKR